MVNTFLPFADFTKSAKALDYKRLGKQRVEAWQILRASLGKTKGWVNHPITKMWRGHERALCDYGIAICKEWISRGYKDTMLDRFTSVYYEFPDTGNPAWLGNDSFHKSHQSNLNRKNHIYYTFNVERNLPYLWYEKTPNSNQVWKVGKKPVII
ncbi:MAG: MSMEG_6728 family protein [Nitrosarchaeum sp.]|nr:MSMEG_6728 family protein [Nitrosarchaeum sp.]MDW7641630.1 MSMEG_6728 family protein [Nitrosarchaeum sp.]